MEKRLVKYFYNGEWHYASVKDIGDLDMLNTFEKGTIVDAINSIVENGGITNETTIANLNKISEKVRLVDEKIDNHIADRNNPHGVTAEQVGTYTKAVIDSKTSNTLTSSKTYTDGKISDLNTKITTHISDTNNPHNVTAEQVDTYTKAVIDQKSQGILADAKSYIDSIKDYILDLINKTKQALQDYTYPKATIDSKDTSTLGTAKSYTDTTKAEIIAGNVYSATKLQTARNINGVAFDGTKNITLSVDNIGTYSKADIDSKDANVLGQAKSYVDSVKTAINETISDSVANVQNQTYTKAEIDGKDSATLSSAKAYTDTSISSAKTELNNNIAREKANIIAGNVASATKLQTARNINGVAFDGTRDISISAGQVGSYTKAETDNKIDEKIGEIEIGGRNLLRHSDVSTENLKYFHTEYTTVEVVADGNIKVYKISAANTTNPKGVWCSFNDGIKNLLAGRTYTYSFWLKSNMNDNFAFDSIGHYQTRTGSEIHATANQIYKPSTIQANVWTKVSATFYVTKDCFFVPYFWFLQPNQVIYIYDIMLEEGNTATPWIPAPEDQQSQIDGINNNLSNNYYQKTTVDSKISTATTGITAQYTQDITTRLGNYYDKSTIDSKLTIDGQGITTYVKNTQSKLDNLQVGGRNLIVNSEKYTKDNPWQRTISGGDDYTVTDMYFPVVKGQTYTFQFCTNRPLGWHQGDGTAKGTVHIYLFLQTQDMVGTMNFKRLVDLNNSSLVLKNDKYYQTFTIPTDYDYVRAIVRIDGHADGNKYDLRCWNFQAEEGTKDSTWQPPIESLATKQDITTTLSQANAYSDTKKTEANSYTDSEIGKVKTIISGLNPSSVGTYSKTEIDTKDASTLTSAKSYADTKKSEANSYTDGKISTVNTTINSLTGRITAAEGNIRNIDTKIDNVTIIARAGNGEQITSDPFFDSGTNGIVVYNNSNNGTVTITRENPSGGTQPTGHSYRLRIVHTGTASPFLGGFVRKTYSRNNAEFVVKFNASLPSGASLSFHNNSIGSGGLIKWLTSNLGTGTWQEYSYYVKCGNSGAFHDFGYTAINYSTTPTSSSPLTWYVSSFEVYDISSSQADTIRLMQSNIGTNTSSISGVKNDLTNHANNRNNPHAVTASQVGAYSKSETYSRAEVDNKVNSVTSNLSTYSRNEIDTKDTSTLNNAKSYADTKKNEAVSYTNSQVTDLKNHLIFVGTEAQWNALGATEQNKYILKAIVE